MGVVSKTTCFQSSLSFSLPPVCLMWTVKGLLILLHLHHPRHLSTQHHRQFRIIIQTLVRPMLGATVSTRTPKQDCYNIPRKIQVEVCKTDVHRYCEKFSNIFPFPV